MRSRDIEWHDDPTMDPRDTEKLRPLIERRQVEHLWGHPHWITPRLVTRVFGDGRVLLTLYPIMFRPNHFVVRIDSKTDIDYPGDWLDDIYDETEEEFYEWPWAAAYGFKYHEDADADCDSRISWEEGASWGTMKWPMLKRKKAKSV